MLTAVSARVPHVDAFQPQHSHPHQRSQPTVLKELPASSNRCLKAGDHGSYCYESIEYEVQNEGFFKGWNIFSVLHCTLGIRHSTEPPALWKICNSVTCLLKITWKLEPGKVLNSNIWGFGEPQFLLNYMVELLTAEVLFYITKLCVCVCV